jgi:ribosomal protein S18 acetylase RimI-like enzyme
MSAPTVAASVGVKSVHLGPLNALHRDRLAAIVRATGVFRDSEVDVAVELFDDTFSAAKVGKPAAPDAYRFVGAFTESQLLAGYACYGWTPGTVATWDIYWIAVDPALHGSGIGTALMAEVESRLQAERANLVVVETSSRPDYAPTRRFYQRLGYGEVARVHDFYAPGDDRVIYVKRFEQPDQGGERSHHE